MDTIVALATASGRAGVAIVRVSGPLAWDVCHKLTGQTPEPRVARLCRIRGADGELIDEGLVLLFEKGESFTGDQVAEFQIHGSPAVVRALLKEILATPGVRSAEAGEFTRRAFETGVLDLAEVEGLADLLSAETESQRKLAQRVLDGTVSKLLDGWRGSLIQALAMIEASLDFSDEELPEDLVDHIRAPLERVQESLAQELSGRRASEQIRDGFEVAIVGSVNVGKSTLLNALAGREAAITSEWAGTTRDVIEVRMEIGGLSVTLIDTAGMRDTDDSIEKLGIDRGKERARQADLRIYLKSDPDDEPESWDDQDIMILSKSDLWGVPGISGKTGQGLTDLICQIEGRLKERSGGSSVFSRERHFSKMSSAHRHLSMASRRLAAGNERWELIAEEVRLAIRALDGIVGRVDADDVLGEIFSAFCIGK
ncbi:MAG: tRNA uridine-5-carboxymethylaminomethyl(34) synthesis GTPase MnmE [Pararhodobacter sp.]